jgi:arylsulfatase A-like enzyme
VIAVLVLAVSACDGGQQMGDMSADVDLIPLHGVARLRAETGLISIDSPRSESYFVRGWSTQAIAADGLEAPAVAVVARTALLRFQVLEIRERQLVFSASLSGEIGTIAAQRVTLSLNDTPIGGIQIEAGKTGPYRIDLPLELQRVGLNRVYFTFENFTRDREFEESTRRLRNRLGYPGVAAYFSDIAISIAGAEPVDEAGFVRPAADGTALAQMADSDVQYAFDIAPGSQLNLSGSLQGSVAARVTARIDEQAEPVVLWSLTSRSEGTQDFTEQIALDDFAGKATLFQFTVRSSSGAAPGGVIWKRLRLVLPRSQAAAAMPAAPVRADRGLRHVVLIVLDAARPDFFGCYGHTGGLTPNIDAIAAESAVFRTAIAAAPYTIASMSTVFSGLLPDTHGVRDGRDIFPEELTNMGAVFGQCGYYTLALAGTQFLTRKYGITRPFDEVIYLRQQEDKVEEVSTMDMQAAAKGIRQAAASGKPSFIYIHLLPPHFPYRPPVPWDTKLIDSRVVDKQYLRKIRSFRGDESHPLVQELRLHYQNNLLYADALVGQIVDELKAAGMFDDSLLIITSDHGEAFAEHGALEHGNTVFDEMIRVPLIVRGHGVRAHEVSRQVGLVDLFPTMDELFNLASGVNFDGASFAASLGGDTELLTGAYYARAYGPRLKFTLRGERFKYQYIDHADFLFELPTDPGERQNIAARYPALTAVMRQRGLLMVATNSARSGKGSLVELSAEEEEELRNLGYLQ